jgi:hypothetical protein
MVFGQNEFEQKTRTPRECSSSFFIYGAGNESATGKLHAQIAQSVILICQSVWL